MRLKYANDHDHFVKIKDWMRRTNPNSFYISKWNRLNSIHQKMGLDCGKINTNNIPTPKKVFIDPSRHTNYGIPTE